MQAFSHLLVVAGRLSDCDGAYHMLLNCCDALVVRIALFYAVGGIACADCFHECFFLLLYLAFIS